MTETPYRAAQQRASVAVPPELAVDQRKLRAIAQRIRVPGAKHPLEAGLACSYARSAATALPVRR